MTDSFDSGWKVLCKIGGISALLWIAIVPAEIIISLVPGVEDLSARTVTAVDWFALFQHHWFLGLRNFGLLNWVGAALYIPTILAIYFLLRQDSEGYAILGATIYFIGVAVYFANSRAFPMLCLSREYANAVTDAQRSLIAAAGEALLAEGESRAGILIIEFSFLVISAAMTKSKVFGRVTAVAGILGSVMMMVLEIAFIPPRGVGMLLAAIGGLTMMTWSFLIGARLLKGV